MPEPRRLDARRLTAEVAVAAVALALLACAAAADVAWFDRHFLPDWRMPRTTQLAILWAGRGLAVAVGLHLLLVGRPAFGRLVARRSWSGLMADCAPTLAALILAAPVRVRRYRTSGRGASEESAGSLPLA